MISTTAEYALRALTQLAAQPAGSAILGRELAGQSGVPANYLAKILLSLRNAGMVTTNRGTGGGYRLSRPAQRIRLIEVVELFDGAALHNACILGRDRQCSETTPCSAHGAWRRVRRSYNQFLARTTVADISAHAGPGPSLGRSARKHNSAKRA
ncbi:MAG: Rrf2 family transcriptional regulator [Terriglobales bacterium]